MMRSRTGCSSRSALAIPRSLAVVHNDAIIHKTVIGSSRSRRADDDRTAGGAGRGGRGRCRPAPYRLGNLVPDLPPGPLAEADQTRGLPKRAWEIVILLVPTFGGILYLL